MALGQSMMSPMAAAVAPPHPTAAVVERPAAAEVERAAAVPRRTAAVAAAKEAAEAAVRGHATPEQRSMHRRLIAAPCERAPELAAPRRPSLRAPRCRPRPWRGHAGRSRPQRAGRVGYCTTEGRSAGAEGRSHEMAPPRHRRLRLLLRLAAASPCARLLRARARAGPRRWTGGAHQMHHRRAGRRNHRTRAVPGNCASSPAQSRVIFSGCRHPKTTMGPGSPPA